MADTAGVFDKGVNYKRRFINKYSRTTNIPSVLFLDVKFHPTMPDHIIVLSSNTLSHPGKINTLVPMELLDSMEKEIEDNYLTRAKNYLRNEKRTGTAAVPKMPDEDILDPFGSMEDQLEGGDEDSDEEADEESYDGEGPDSEDGEEGSQDDSEDEEDSQFRSADTFRSRSSVGDSENDTEGKMYFSELDQNPDVLPDRDVHDTSRDPHSLKSNVDLSGFTETKKEKKLRLKEEKELQKKLQKEIKREETLRKKEAKMMKKDSKALKFFRKKTNLKKMPKLLQDENDIYDKAVELYLRDKFKLFEYQSVNPLLLRKDEIDEGEGSDESSSMMGVEPDERSKLVTQEFEIPESDGQTFSKMEGWKGGMHVPSVFKHSYQISIWKIDSFGVVKIVNKYFTPKSSRATNTKFPGFVLQLSMDEQTMLMVEKDQDRAREFIVISFDLYSLDILSETSVSVVDESIREEPYYQGKGSELNMYYKGPCEIGDQVPKVNSWNFGNFILAGVSTSSQSRIIYKYRVYNTKTSSLVSTIVRGGNSMLSKKIISMSFDEDNEDILHWATIDRQDIVMLEVNMMTGLADETARYSGFNPVYAFPTEDHSSIYLVHQDKKTKKHELYCTRYQFFDEDEEIKSTESEDHEVHIYKEDIEPLDKLSETINMIKLIGNQLLVISTDDKTGSVLTVYDNLRNIYAMKSEAIIKKGKKVQSMKFDDFFTYEDTSSALSE